MQQYPSFDLNVLVACIVSAETGSFLAAGQRLSKDPTVISRRLQALEARLGVRLAERTTRQLALTEAGRAYLAKIKPIVMELEGADREAAGFADGEPRGHLRISLPGSFGKLWLGPLIVEFLKQYPAVTLDIDSTNRFVDLIGERYDLAVRLGELPDSRLIARKVADRKRVICASPAYLERVSAPETPQDLLDHACLVPTARADPYRWSFKKVTGGMTAISVRAVVASDDAELLVDACVGGLGILYTSDWYVSRELAAGRLVEVLPGWQLNDPGGVYVVTPALAGMPSKTRAFSDWLLNRLSPAPWVQHS